MKSVRRTPIAWSLAGGHQEPLSRVVELHVNTMRCCALAYTLPLAMPFQLTDAELATAATAYRATTHQECERAKKMENPTMRGPLATNPRRFAVLAE